MSTEACLWNLFFLGNRLLEVSRPFRCSLENPILFVGAPQTFASCLAINLALGTRLRHTPMCENVPTPSSKALQAAQGPGSGGGEQQGGSLAMGEHGSLLS